MQKYRTWVEKIANKLQKRGLILIEEGEPALSIETASTGSTYATFYLNNGRTFLLRFADHKMGCDGVCDFWAKKYKDGESAVLEAAQA